MVGKELVRATNAALFDRVVAGSDTARWLWHSILEHPEEETPACMLADHLGEHLGNMETALSLVTEAVLVVRSRRRWDRAQVALYFSGPVGHLRRVWVRSHVGHAHEVYPVVVREGDSLPEFWGLGLLDVPRLTSIDHQSASLYELLCRYERISPAPAVVCGADWLLKVLKTF